MSCRVYQLFCSTLVASCQWRRPQVIVWWTSGALRQCCEKSNHIIKYLRSGDYKEGSSESRQQRRVLGCPSKKHSYDNKTGLEDLFAAVGRGTYRIAAEHRRLAPATTACYVIPESLARQRSETVITTCRNARWRHPELWVRRTAEAATPASIRKM